MNDQRLYAIARKVALRYASSALPGEGARAVHPNIEGPGLLTQFVDQGSTVKKIRSDGSIYDVDTAEDIPKLDSERDDSIDLTGLTPRFNVPSVPDNVRR